MPFFFSFSICASSSANEILALDLIAIFGSTGCSLTGSVSAATVSLTDSFSFVSVSGATVSSTCVEVSSTGEINGRGAYLKADKATLEKAKKTKALEKALEVKISDEVYEKIGRYLND